MSMDLGAYKSSVEVIKEGVFEATYFRDIYFDVNSKSYRKSWKGFSGLKSVESKYYCSNYYDVTVNEYGVKYGTLLRF